MKFIVDAQLPYRLAKVILDRGLDAIHTNDLPEKNRNADNENKKIAREKKRIVITKDNDFLESHILKNEPAHLFLITTGNITNKALLMRFEKNWTEIEEKLARYYFLEMDNTKLIIHS